MLRRTIDVIYNNEEFTRLFGGKTFNSAIKKRTLAVLQDAVSRTAETGSKLDINWYPRTKASFESAPKGWRHYNKPRDFDEHFCSVFLLRIPYLFHPSTPDPTTVRIKLDFIAKGPKGGADVFGSGGSFGITLYQDALLTEYDLPRRINKNSAKFNLFVGSVIAHEMMHALGKSGHWHGTDGTVSNSVAFVDSSPWGKTPPFTAMFSP